MVKNKTLKNEEIENLKQNYILLSKIKIYKTQDFLKDLRILNKNSGEMFPINFDPIKNKKNDYLNLIYRSQIIQQEAIEAQKQAFFITLTLPSEYHTHKKNTHGNLVKNENYNPELTKEHGYDKLNSFFRSIQKDFFDNIPTKKNINGKKITFKFVKVIEPHQDFTPHLHGIVYVPQEHVVRFKEHVKNLLGCEVLEKKENKTIFIKNKNMGRCEMEEIKDTTRASSYLLKYIAKSAKSANLDDDFHVLDGWKKANKIRNFTTSMVSIPRYLFNAVFRKAGHLLNKNLLSNDLNILQLTEQKIFAEIEIFNADTWCVETKIKGKAFSKEDEIKINDDAIKVKITFMKFLGENKKGEPVIKYQKIRTIINFKDEKIFDSNDFELIDLSD